MLQTTMAMKGFYCWVLILCFHLPLNIVLGGLTYEGSETSSVGTAERVVKKDERTPVVATEFGSISSVDIDDGVGRNNYHLQFITMEPNSLFLPVLLHSDLVFYVQTGSGTLSWTTDDDDINQVSLQRGDVYRLKSGTLFYLNSNQEPERSRVRIVAIFANPDEEQLQQGPSVGPYSSINDLVRGFDKPVLQAAFQVPEEVIEEITSATDTPAIVHAEQKSRTKFWEGEVMFINALFGIQRFSKLGLDNKKKKHTKTFNFFKEDPDFQNPNGWSKVVTKHDLPALHGSQIGVLMVNLTKGSIMGPHWNPSATEVSVVLEGEGMVQVVCPSALTNKDCRNSWIRVEEGDVFTVPRFHPMAQTSFNNSSLVFMGFSTTSKKNHPQFLAGKASVLQTLDKSILGVSFNVSNTTVDQLLTSQKESIILGCISCAEEQEIVMEEEIERHRQEERKREDEEKRKREEEERKREEEEKRKREEEERKREEEEEARRKEEEEEKRKREEEEEARRREEEEEKRKRDEEEAARRREEEEEARRKEEEEIRKREEEERKREEEEAARRREEEEEEAARRREEEEKRKREEEESRRREEDEKRKKEEEEARRREEEEEVRKREEEEQRKHEQEEEQRKREEEEQRQREEQRRREEEEEQRRREEEDRTQREEEEEQRRREEEEEQRRREKEEERRKREEEEQRQREEEEQRGRQEEKKGEEESEEEMARREEEERVGRQREEEEPGSKWNKVTLHVNKQGRRKQG